MPDDETPKPDVLAGVALDDIPASGFLEGKVGDEDVLLVRTAAGLHAIGAKCTHLGAPLAKGLVVGGEVRCPWHHACFDIATGRAVKAPAFDPLPVWPVVVEDGRARVTASEPLAAPALPGVAAVGPFVIVGGGAAGYAAARTLKDAAPGARCIVLSAEDHPPYDRTLLTKDYLDGTFGDEKLRIAQRSLEDLGVELRIDAEVARIDRERRAVVLTNGEAVPYAKLLLATGAEPKRLDVPGADRDHVRVLRSLADCRVILERLGAASHVVVLGSSFIGLEAAASLKSRGVDVTVVTPETRPLAAIFGEGLSDAVMAVHRENGVAFRLGREATTIHAGAVDLDDGEVLPADLVIVGIGVEPRTRLAEAAGLAVDDGVTLDERLRTSDAHIFAAGDIANWPDPHGGHRIRVEHWVVAERQGVIAARNMLGAADAYAEVPFFWTKHFDLSIRYLGHAGRDDVAAVDGTPAERDATVTWRRNGRTTAVATIGRDREALTHGVALERTRA